MEGVHRARVAAHVALPLRIIPDGHEGHHSPRPFTYAAQAARFAHLPYHGAAPLFCRRANSPVCLDLAGYTAAKTDPVTAGLDGAGTTIAGSVDVEIVPTWRIVQTLKA